MKNFCKFTLVILIIMQVLTINKLKAQDLPKNDPLYELVFVDEFDSTTLDTIKWATRWPWSNANMKNSNFITRGSDTMDVALLRHAPFNQGNWEFDTIGSGFTRMIYKKEDCTGFLRKDWIGSLDDTLVDFKYSGAMLRSNELFKYGYFEYKFRIDNENHDLSDSSDYNAYGPNFWMFNSDDSVYTDNPTRPPANYCELDILELYGVDWSGDANIHYEKHNTDIDTFFHAKGIPTIQDSIIVGESPYSAIYTQLFPHNWHIVSCEWTKEYADFYYDTPNFHRRYSDTLIKIDELIEMPVTIDNYMPAFQFWTDFNAINTKQPIFYDIDYVKIYQIKQEYSDTIYLNTNASDFQSKVYKSLTLGGSGGNATLDFDKHHLCAEEFVLLEEGTELSGTAELTISCRPYQHDQWRGYHPQKTKSNNSNVYDPEVIDALINNKLLEK